MAEQFALDVDERTLFGKKVNRLRRDGILPATVYGKGIGPFSVQLNAREFGLMYRRAGRTSLIEVSVPGQPKQSAFVHAIQRHPVRRDIIHVDFLVVDLKVKITVAIPMRFINEPEIVERGDAILTHVLTTIEIRTLPANVPSHVDIDVSGLENFDQSIMASEIPLPDGVELVTPGETVVASLTPPQLVEEEDVEATEEGAEPELVRETREGEDADGDGDDDKGEAGN